MRFGKQRPASDVAAFILLFLGFAALALAFWILKGTLLGLFLPIGYVVGAVASLHKDIREIELRDDLLLVRTFFREYPIPRTHVTRVVGTTVEVLNGNRYMVAPPGTDAAEITRALKEWSAGGGV
jgi:hypothetical protein